MTAPRREPPSIDRQICRVCGCNENNPCRVECHWIEQDLCSVCADLRNAIATWSAETRKPTEAGLVRLLHEVTE